MASSVDRASKMPLSIAGEASVSVAARNTRDIKMFGYAPLCSFRAAWPDVRVRSDMAFVSLVWARGE